MADSDSRRGRTLLFAVAVALIAAPVLVDARAHDADKDDAVAPDHPKGSFYVGQVGGGTYMGVTLEEETEHAEGGARITSVVDDSPAAEAGLQEGDIIVGFGEHTIRGPGGLSHRLHERDPGDTVKLTVIRDGRKRKMDIELGERSTMWRALGLDALKDLNIEIPEIHLPNLDFSGLEGLQDLEELKHLNLEELNLQGLENRLRLLGDCEEGDCAYSIAPWGGRPRLGVQLVETTPELRRHLGGNEDAGVLVSKVLKGTPAENAGISVGDLIVSVAGEPVGGTWDLRRELAKQAGGTFDVGIVRDGRATTIRVTLPEPDDDLPDGPRAYYLAPDTPGAPSVYAVPTAPEAPTAYVVPQREEVAGVPTAPEAPTVYVLPEGDTMMVLPEAPETPETPETPTVYAVPDGEVVIAVPAPPDAPRVYAVPAPDPAVAVPDAPRAPVYVVPEAPSDAPAPVYVVPTPVVAPGPVPRPDEDPGPAPKGIRGPIVEL